jgi:hypothetical protein
MRSFYYRTYDEFAVDIGREYTHLKDEYKIVSVIAKYEDARHITESLIRLGYPIVSLLLDNPECCGYYDELVVTLDNEGIWCEPMKLNGVYLSCEADVIYIMGNCSTLCIKGKSDENIYEANVGEDEYEDTCDLETDDEVHIGKNDFDDNIHSLDVSWYEGDTSHRFSYWTKDDDSIEEKFREIVTLLISNRNI